MTFRVVLAFAYRFSFITLLVAPLWIAPVAYPLTINPTIGEVKKLTAADAAMNDRFGESVAISGDTAVVGSLLDGDAGHGSGSAYVFARDQGGVNNWGQLKKLVASDAVGGDNFGVTVAITGDTIVVGAWADDDAGSASGSAYIFERNQEGADNWGEAKKLTASDAAAGDNFGYSVAISGDTIIVGAIGDADVGANTGAAYVFGRAEGGPGNWGEVTKITASDAAAGDLFGFPVAISGDDAVVGATRNTDAGDESGSAYVFGRDQDGPDNWGEVKKLAASGLVGGHQFGSAAAISGDIVVVGAPNVGEAAYVFARNEGGTDNWGEIKKLTSGGAPIAFGYSAAISGDAVLVGGIGGNGSAYVFERNLGGPDSWGQIQSLTASDAAELDNFGWSAAISGDTLIVGANANDDAGSTSGSAYVFRAGLPAAATPIAPTGTSADTTPTYIWQEVFADAPGGAMPDAATWYQLWVDGPSGNVVKQWYTAASACVSGTCSVTPSTALDLGLHQWWVRTWNPQGNGPWSPASSFTVSSDSGPPGTPILTAPSGSIDVTTPTYSWYAVPSDRPLGASAKVTADTVGDAATWYYLWVNGPAGNVLKRWYEAASVCSGLDCAVTPEMTLGAGAHTWWIQAWNAQGTGPWSAGVSFTAPAVGVAPAQPELTAPTGSIADTTPAYTWQRVDGATWYYLWVDGPSGNVIKQWLTATSVCAGDVCSVTPATMLAAGAHRWWIRGWNSSGNSPWSARGEFGVQ